jgi:ATP-dependent Clp protease ATP-binding subunit ClpC
MYVRREPKYERFTDQALYVLQLSNREAQRLGHEFIGTEHILLGLVKYRWCLAAKILKNLNIDLQKIRSEIKKTVEMDPDHVVTMPKLPQTPAVKKVIEYSIDGARGLNHNYVGTEHLLLGLLREQGGVAARVLTGLGVSFQGVREELVNILSGAAASGGATKRAWPYAVGHSLRRLLSRIGFARDRGTGR